MRPPQPVRPPTPVPTRETAPPSDIAVWPVDGNVPDAPIGRAPLYRLPPDATPEVRAACTAHNRKHHPGLLKFLRQLRAAGITHTVVRFKLLKERA